MDPIAIVCLILWILFAIIPLNTRRIREVVGVILIVILVCDLAGWIRVPPHARDQHSPLVKK